MLHDLPAGFYASLFGATAAAGLALWTVYLLLRRAAGRARLRGLHADDDGSAVVEFPFALLVLVVLVLMTCQLAFMTAAYLVVDYAAFAAVRSAVVVLPQDLGDDEGPNRIKDKRTLGGVAGGSVSGGKWFDLRSAAALACYPIAGDYTNPENPNASIDENALPGPMRSALDIFDLELPSIEAPSGPTQTFGDIAGRGKAVARLAYAYFNTEVDLSGVDDGAGAHDLLTVEVTHWFSLRVPYASRIFRRPKTHTFFGIVEVEPGLAGPVTPIRARASMLNEGPQGKTPKKYDEYEAPD